MSHHIVFRVVAGSMERQVGLQAVDRDEATAVEDIHVQETRRGSHMRKVGDFVVHRDSGKEDMCRSAGHTEDHDYTSLTLYSLRPYVIVGFLCL